MEISDKPTTLPRALQDEYNRSFATAHDIDASDDPLDFSDVCVDSESSGRVVPVYCDLFLYGVGDYERDRASDRARGGYVPGDGSTAVDRRSCEEGDVVVGHGGVTYNRFGHGGVLPGYPTQEGMTKLIIDRMVYDQLRLAEGML